MRLKRAEFVEDSWCQYRMKHPCLHLHVFLDAQELYCSLFDNEEKRDVEYHGEGFKEELLAAFRYFRKKYEPALESHRIDDRAVDGVDGQGGNDNATRDK